MKRLLLILSIVALTACTHNTSVTFDIPKDEEVPELYVECFDLEEYEFDAVAQDTTPSDFMKSLSSDTVVAVINGVYYGADDGLTQGYVRVNEKDFASGKGRVSGYLLIGNEGDVTSLESLEAVRLHSQTDVIGTHPLLISQGRIHEQSIDERYNQSLALRSALGTTTGRNICFTVSTDLISMDQWSTLLLNYGFADAINLDGGSVSQMATQDQTYGVGIENTKLLFVVKSRNQ